MSDREVPYQALLFETIRWNFMNGGDRYGIIPVLRMRRVREHACSSYASCVGETSSDPDSTISNETHSYQRIG